MKYDHILGRGIERWAGAYTPAQLTCLRNYSHAEILQSGSYRSGKTETGCRGAIRHALAFQNSRVAVTRATRAALTSTTLVTLLELLHPSLVADWSNTELIATLYNGSTIEFYGCDYPDRLGSLNLSHIFVDEASEVSEESLGMLAGRLSLPLRPDPGCNPAFRPYQAACVERELRQMVLATNPKSRSHHLYKRFYGAPGSTQSAVPSTVFENPHLPQTYLYQLLTRFLRSPKPEEWVRAKVDELLGYPPGDERRAGYNLLPDLNPFGQRNLLGQWVALEGAIYELDYDSQVLEPNQDPAGPHSYYIYGVDHGFHNPRVLVIRVTGRDLRTVAYWPPTAQAGKGESVAEAIEKLAQAYPPTAIYLPHDQPKIKRDLRARWPGKVHNADTTVIDGIDTVSSEIGGGRLKFIRAPGFELFWGEMEGYQWATERGSGASKDAPVKADDHHPDALRYPVHTHLKRNALRDIEPEDLYSAFRDERPKVDSFW